MKNKTLITARQNKGFTQTEIASKVNITPICYQRYEAGERTPRADVAIRIADALGIRSYTAFKELWSTKGGKENGEKNYRWRQRHRC